MCSAAGCRYRWIPAATADVLILPDITIQPVPPKEEPIYLLVEVRQHRDLAPVRRAIQGLGRNVATVPVRPDRTFMMRPEPGTLTPVQYAETKALFEHHMGPEWRARHGR